MISRVINIPRLGFRRLADQIRQRGFYIRTVLEEFVLDHPHEEGKTIGPAKREFVNSRSAVCVLVYCPSERKILMSRQFRMPVMFNTGDVEKAWIYELIAGVVGDGEDPKETAIREAKEEAGIDLPPSLVTHAKTLYPSPGISSEVWSIYMCAVPKTTPLDRNGGLESEAEAIVSNWISYDDAVQLMHVDIWDAKTYLALMCLERAGELKRTPPKPPSFPPMEVSPKPC